MIKPTFKDLITFACFIALLSVALLALCLTSGNDSCLTKLERIGAYLGGIAAVVGIPFLILNLILQKDSFEQLREEQLKAKREAEFKLRCESIEAAFNYVSNVGGTSHGAAAIIRYGELCKSGTMNMDGVIINIGVTSLKAVLAGLIEIVDWTLKDKEHFVFHSIYRVRFVAILLAFENMLENGDTGLTRGELQRKYLPQGEKFPLVLSIWDLHRKDFDLWVEYDQFKSAPIL